VSLSRFARHSFPMLPTWCGHLCRHLVLLDPMFDRMQTGHPAMLTIASPYSALDRIG
jgi:hypothetical protein